MKEGILHSLTKSYKVVAALATVPSSQVDSISFIVTKPVGEPGYGTETCLFHQSLLWLLRPADSKDDVKRNTVSWR